MVAKQLHVKSHYVSKCYLKRWENADGKVLVYRTLVSHPNVPIWEEKSVSAIAYQEHLYTQMISGCEPDELESWLGREFESPANEALDKATTGRRLTPTDWTRLINFLAAQDVRTPSNLREHTPLMEKALPEILSNTADDIKEMLDSGNIDELKIQNEKFLPEESFPLKITNHIDEGAVTGVIKIETSVGRSTWIYSIRHFLKHTSKILHAHKWSIVKPAKGYYWPTSDNPVVKLNYRDPENYDLKGGWDFHKGKIFFPIGPEHAMFVAMGDRPPQKNSRFSEELTKQLIKIVAENAHREIFSHFENNELPTLRKRIVDQEMYAREQNVLKKWHQQNTKMEREFFNTPEK